MNRDIDLQHILQAYLDSDSKLQEEEKIAQSQMAMHILFFCFRI
jgi:hypothetical protein